MNSLIKTCLCMTLCFAFCVLGGRLHGQTIYSFTGVADIADNNPNVSNGETYVAEFQVDLSAPDSDLSSGRGEYLGAILSSSIVFSGGYNSQVDFTGGDVVIFEDFPGGGIFLSTTNFPGDLEGLIRVIDVATPLDSDALLTDALATPLVGRPLDAGLSLSEPDGSVNSGLSNAVFSVNTTAVPEPSAICLLGLGFLLVVAPRRRP